MKTGTVRWFSVEKGYGFIEPDEGGGDVFVPIDVVKNAGLPKLLEGQKLRFWDDQGRNTVSSLQALENNRFLRISRA